MNKSGSTLQTAMLKGLILLSHENGFVRICRIYQIFERSLSAEVVRNFKKFQDYRNITKAVYLENKINNLEYNRVTGGKRPNRGYCLCF